MEQICPGEDFGPCQVDDSPWHRHYVVKPARISFPGRFRSAVEAHVQDRERPVHLPPALYLRPPSTRAASRVVHNPRREGVSKPVPIHPRTNVTADARTKSVTTRPRRPRTCASPAPRRRWRILRRGRLRSDAPNARRPRSPMLQLGTQSKKPTIPRLRLVLSNPRGRTRRGPHHRRHVFRVTPIGGLSHAGRLPRDVARQFGYLFLRGAHSPTARNFSSAAPVRSPRKHSP